MMRRRVHVLRLGLIRDPNFSAGCQRLPVNLSLEKNRELFFRCLLEYLAIPFEIVVSA